MADKPLFIPEIPFKNSKTLRDWVMVLAVDTVASVGHPVTAVAWAFDKLRLVACRDPAVETDMLTIVVNDRVMVDIPLVALFDNGWFTLSAPWPVDVTDTVKLRSDHPCTVAIAGTYLALDN